jgi:hypothetical protein
MREGEVYLCQCAPEMLLICVWQHSITLEIICGDGHCIVSVTKRVQCFSCCVCIHWPIGQVCIILVSCTVLCHEICQYMFTELSCNALSLMHPKQLMTKSQCRASRVPTLPTHYPTLSESGIAPASSCSADKFSIVIRKSCLRGSAHGASPMQVASASATDCTSSSHVWRHYSEMFYGG